LVPDELLCVVPGRWNGLLQSSRAPPWCLPPSSFNMPGRLRVQRPSPTTVSFTVSNAPLRSNSPAKVLFGLQVLLRAILFCCVIIVGTTRLRHIFFYQDGRFIPWQHVWSTPLGSKICDLVDTYNNPWAIAVISALVIWGVFRRGYTGMRAELFAAFIRNLITVAQRNRSWSSAASASKLPPHPPPISRRPRPDLFLRHRSKI
jgi:hypothetical protein